MKNVSEVAPLDLQMPLDTTVEASDGSSMASEASSARSKALSAHVDVNFSSSMSRGLYLPYLMSASLLRCLRGFNLPYLMSIFLLRCLCIVCPSDVPFCCFDVCNVGKDARIR